MAPLPPSSTARLWYRYVTGEHATAQEHTVMWRYNSTQTTEYNAQGWLLGLLLALGESYFHVGWRVLDARFAAAGSNISLPVPLDPTLAEFEGTQNLGYSAQLEAVEVSFPFRSVVTGRKGDFSLFPASSTVPPTFRLINSSGVQEALNDASNAGALVAIDDTAPQHYGYNNWNYNSYWERQLRT